MTKVFTSYAREDTRFVDRLTSKLKSSGVEVWTDRLDLAGGQSWRTQISAAIKNCDALMVVLSPSSAQSRYVVREITLADENRKQIVPVLFQKCEIPPEAEFELAGLHIIDFSIQPFEQAASQLLRVFNPSAVSYSPRPQARSANRLTLAQTLPGNWRVQLSVQTYWGPQSGFLNLSMYNNYTFQLVNQAIRAQGNWSIPQFNHLVLNGVQTNGHMTMPYNTMIQFVDVNNTRLQGITTGNEQAIWERI